MRPSHLLDFRPTDMKEKKIALLAVISFNDANSVPYSRGKLYEYFDINERTARKWCVAAASAAASRPAQQPDNGAKNTGSRSLKRARSEDALAEILSASINISSKQPPASARQNLAGNCEPGRKKLKKDEVSSASPPPPPPQLLAPPRRKAAQPRKRRQTGSTEPSVDF